MQVQQENGTIFLPRFRHVFHINMRVEHPSPGSQDPGDDHHRDDHGRIFRKNA